MSSLIANRLKRSYKPRLWNNNNNYYTSKARNFIFDDIKMYWYKFQAKKKIIIELVIKILTVD